jgi:hypothetical protein
MFASSEKNGDRKSQYPWLGAKNEACMDVLAISCEA